jgi:hypothetical protein
MTDDRDYHAGKRGKADRGRVWQVTNVAGFDPGRLCEAALTRFTGVDGLGLSTQAPWPDSRVRYASDPVSLQIDTLQNTLAEGPCRTAMSTGQLVLVPDVATPDPWAATTGPKR